MYQYIPEELRQLSQWVCANENKIPINPITNQRASVTDLSTWTSFENVTKADCKYIGFVLTKDDPYCIIDLDNKPENPASEEELRVQDSILSNFNTYIERSASGNGYHVVCRAELDRGRRRGNVEIYSNERYMIFTGNVVKSLAISNEQTKVNELMRTMPSTVKSNNLVQIDNDIPDADIVERAMNAANAEKFLKLSNGDWQKDYPSQSEADFALMSMLCFYSKDNAQCRRIFRYSALGKRDKAQRDAYLNYAISKIRATDTLVQVHKNEVSVNLTKESGEEAVLERQKNLKHFDETNDKGLEFPAGLVGDVADYIWQSSIRPVREVSLAAAISLIAGVSARAFNISGTGLNLYIILLAPTGSGKEGADSGISRILSAARSQVPAIETFIGPAVFGSGQALLKHLNDQPCFLSILGEFGLTLQNISSERANNAERQLKRVLLDLYSKSGHNSVMRSIIYSDKDKNSKNVKSPNVTILGESTPEAFLESLTQSQISEGLIPRFTFISYEGKRPFRNCKAGFPPNEILVDTFSDLANVSLKSQSQQSCTNVQISEEAERLLTNFDKLADNHVNDDQDEANKQLWNRAHLKALKLAALVSVGINPSEPIVSLESAKWAIQFVERDISYISRKFKSGEFGSGDSKQLSDMRSIIDSYSLERVNSKTYNFPNKLLVKGIIPYAFLQRRCASMSAFRNDKRGSTSSLKRTIESLIAEGYLTKCDKNYIKGEFNFNGECYIKAQNNV